MATDDAPFRSLQPLPEMSNLLLPPVDPERDLVLERVIPITPQQAYDA